MTITVHTPTVDELQPAMDALRGWQVDGAPMHLHPGDLGWFWRFGVEATAAAVRTWSRAGKVLALGLLDGATLLRMSTAPDVRRDEELARTIARDVADPEHGVLPAGPVSVEAPADALLQDVLAEAGWGTDDPWTPLRRDLGEPVGDPGVRVEVVGPDRAAQWAEVVGAAFGNPASTARRWHTMASGVAYADARSLLAYDADGAAVAAVAAVTVWSAGPGRPGLIEPMGAHPDHRGRGHGRAVTVAAAAALRELGSSSAVVCTPSANVGGVAAYRSAGFRALPEVRDRVRV